MYLGLQPFIGFGLYVNFGLLLICSPYYLFGRYDDIWEGILDLPYTIIRLISSGFLLRRQVYRAARCPVTSVAPGGTGLPFGMAGRLVILLSSLAGHPKGEPGTWVP